MSDINGVYEIDWFDFLKIANGLDASGHPKSSIVLGLHKQPEGAKQAVTIENVFFKNANTHLVSSGACMVVQSDFPNASMKEFGRAHALCDRWLRNVYNDNNDMNDQMLTLTIIPELFGGQFYLFLDQLVYMTSYSIKDGKRLVLCFDATTMQAVEDQSINYAELKTLVMAELDRELKEVNIEIESVEAEKKRLEEDNIYGQAVKASFNENNEYLEIDPDQEENIEQRGRRYTHDDEE